VTTTTPVISLTIGVLILGSSVTYVLIHRSHVARDRAIGADSYSFGPMLARRRAEGQNPCGARKLTIQPQAASSYSCTSLWGSETPITPLDLQVRRRRKKVSGNFLIVARRLEPSAKTPPRTPKEESRSQSVSPQDLSASDSQILSNPTVRGDPSTTLKPVKTNAAWMPAGPMLNALVAGVIRVSVPFRICAPSELVHGLSSTCLVGVLRQGALTDAREQGRRR
jgi:hypothetical protein